LSVFVLNTKSQFVYKHMSHVTNAAGSELFDRSQTWERSSGSKSFSWGSLKKIRRDPRLQELSL